MGNDTSTERTIAARVALFRYLAAKGDVAIPRQIEGEDGETFGQDDIDEANAYLGAKGYVTGLSGFGASGAVLRGKLTPEAKLLLKTGIPLEEALQF